MSREYTMEISRPFKIGERLKRPKLVIKMFVQQADDLSETDIAKMLFAVEFAANGHSELPIRVHINELTV
jgi:hypothetical protein